MTRAGRILKKPRDVSDWIIKGSGYVLITAFAALCLFPFLLILSASFSSEKLLTLQGVRIWPREFTLFAYRLVFENPHMMIGSYAVTICLTVSGTAAGLFLTAMTAYVLQRPDFPLRGPLSLFFYFTTLFSGGLIPFYLLVTRHLRLGNNYLAILLPSLLSAWNIIMMKNFLKTIPHALTESALIDGANDFTIFVRIILPMAVPSLATIGLFIALGYWNEWYNSMLFLNSSKVQYRPLQLFLYNLINKADYIRNSAARSNIPMQDVPLESMKMASAIIATGPVVLFYPFVQKYFISGISIGAVKG
jgi:putative aldouronate transport system permease protein